jgi:hypothetical protein
VQRALDAVATAVERPTIFEVDVAERADA